jgi:hypothetical protein
MEIRNGGNNLSQAEVFRIFPIQAQHKPLN